MKRIMMLLATAAMVLTFSSLTYAVDLSMLPKDLQNKIEKLLESRYPPEVKSVSISPEAPAADAPVTVTAVIQNDADITSDTTDGVSLFYSADGGKTWADSVAMTQGDDEKTWTGEIPGQPAGTEVVYALSAVDSSGNVLSDVPCKTDDFPFEGYDEASCISKDNAADACKTPRPIGCMMPLARGDQPLKEIPPYADFLDYQAGYNDDDIFITASTAEKIGEGTASPLDIRGYAVVLLNLDKGGKNADLDSLLSLGAVAVYAPMAKIAGGLVKPCFFGYQKGTDFVQDEKSMTCKLQGNKLILKIKREALGDNPSGQVVMFVADLHITSISPIAGEVWANNHWTTVNMTGNRSYKVE